MKRSWLHDNWPLLLGAAAGVGLLVYRKEASFLMTDTFTKGERLSYGDFDENLGVVLNDPEKLRQTASRRYGLDIPMEVYAAGRMARSEGAAEGAVRIHVALNDLKTFRYADNLYELLTYSTDPSRRGFFGKQYSPPFPPTHPKANKRRFATKRDPYRGDIDLAFAVIDQHRRGIDPSRGATKFIDRSSMGKQQGSVSFAEKDAEWKASGYVAYTVPELGDDLVLYRKA